MVIIKNAFIVITIWKSSIRRRNSYLSVRNTTEKTVYIKQANVDLSHITDGTPEDFTIAVPPQMTIPFGWTRIQDVNTVMVGVPVNDSNDLIYSHEEIDLNFVDENFLLGSAMIGRVEVWGPGKLLVLSSVSNASQAQEDDADTPDTKAILRPTNFISFKLTAVAVSLISGI